MAPGQHSLPGGGLPRRVVVARSYWKIDRLDMARSGVAWLFRAINLAMRDETAAQWQNSNRVSHRRKGGSPAVRLREQYDLGTFQALRQSDVLAEDLTASTPSRPAGKSGTGLARLSRELLDALDGNGEVLGNVFDWTSPTSGHAQGWKCCRNPCESTS